LSFQIPLSLTFSHLTRKLLEPLSKAINIGVIFALLITAKGSVFSLSMSYLPSQLG